jgi:hypothetical protein
MSDRLAIGAARLAQRLQDAASHSVTYRRGAAATVLLATSTVGPLLRVTDSGGAVKMTRVDRDFLIALTVFPYSEPARDDLIDEDGLRYQVLPPGKDEPAYRRSGASWRIHTKGIGATPP